MAAMEARITGSEDSPKPTLVRSKPVKVRPKQELAKEIRKKKYRRSMSDSNEAQNTFKQMKELWDQKVESGMIAFTSSLKYTRCKMGLFSVCCNTLTYSVCLLSVCCKTLACLE